MESSPSYNGRDPSGKWMVLDTICLLCDEVDVEADMDIAIAKQWRAFRDGYISWYPESQRYKLHFLRPQKFYRRG
jgi:hypothetical protein